MLKKYPGVILAATICLSLSIAILMGNKNTEAPSNETVSGTNTSTEGKNTDVLPDEVISESVASCTSHTPWHLIKTEWVDAPKDDPASNGHHEKEIVWALCKDCGTPFFYETGEERTVKSLGDEGYAVNTAGYVYSSDLDAGEPITPSEALAQQTRIEELIEGCDGEEIIVFRTIPLYDVDGITILDEYNISFTSTDGF